MSACYSRCASHVRSHLVCQSKFLQHVSTESEIREAAEAAGKKFAAFKAASRSRGDVFAAVQAFAATAEADVLRPYERHFVDALLSDFKRGGLTLGTEQRVELQRLLDADSAACAKYSSNLSADKTELTFSPAEVWWKVKHPIGSTPIPGFLWSTSQ